MNLSLGHMTLSTQYMHAQVGNTRGRADNILLRFTSQCMHSGMQYMRPGKHEFKYGAHDKALKALRRSGIDKKSTQCTVLLYFFANCMS
jgi:hypothetical protein